MNYKNLLLTGVIVILSGCTAATTATPTDTTSEITESPDTLTEESTTTDTQTSSYTMTDISTHDNADDCWLVIANDVYDVTDFITDHPGGDEILKGCGTDATSLFSSEREHQSTEAQDMLPTLKIGELSS